MRASLMLLAVAAALWTGSAGAQEPARPAAANADVVVKGVRSKPSGWREAETSHLVVLSDGSEAELIRLTRNLERLHFLLSGLLDRTDAPDPTVKIRITLIGDVAQFSDMDLKNRRWQQGPFNDLFGLTRYYDPRDDGAVMATTRVDQRTVIERTQMNAVRLQGLLSDPAIARSLGATDPSGQAELSLAVVGSLATAGLRGEHDLPVTFGENAIEVPAESLLYAGYAQHFLQTYFPAAYPRWYLDGFGQVFASMVAKGDTVLEYGRSPRGASAVLREFGSYPIADVLSDRYLSASPGKTRWTPIHAWMLTHFLFFSDTRRPQLRQYLAARASGQDAETAARVFGDQKELARELRAYFGARKPYEVVTYPAERIEQPLVRRLTQGEAAFVKGRLELGSRVVVPAAPGPDTDPAIARRITSERDTALRERDRWLKRLRIDAARWPGELGAQLLLAEAECRSGNADLCLQTADRAVAMAPRDGRSLTWKGMAMALQAAGAPEAQRPERLRAARRMIASANRLDLESVQPLLAFHASFVATGQPEPASAVDGLKKAVIAVPNAPATRVELATALAGRGEPDAARDVVMPVAAGAYDSPERPAARALAARLAAAPRPSAADRP